MNKVFVCPRTKAGKKSAHSTCAKRFAEIHDPPLEIKSNPGGGNCLFYSIAQYGQMMNFEPLKKTHQELRREMVDYALDHLEEIQEYIVQNNINNDSNNNNNNNNNNNYEEKNAMEIVLEKITNMYQDKIWYSEMGDIMPQILSRVYPINVMIYNVYDTSTENVENDDVIQPVPFYHHPDSPWIYILRVHDGHFELMYPKEATKEKKLSVHVKKEKNKLQQQNNLQALTNSLESIYLSNQVAAKPTSTLLNQKNASLRKKSVSPPKNRSTRRSSRLSEKTSPQKKSVSPPKTRSTRKSKSSPVRRTITKSKKNKPNKNAFMSEIEGLFEMNMNEAEMHRVKQNLMNRILSSNLSEDDQAELLSILME